MRPSARYLPEWAEAAKSDPDPSWRARVTVRMLLLHDSGLPAHRDFYKEAKGRDAVLARVMAEPLVREPGTQIEYSDLGFILLGRNRRAAHRRSLDELAQSANFSRRLRMHDSAVQSSAQPARAHRAHRETTPPIASA